MITNIDIETVPQQGGYEEFLTDALENFKAPSSLTKAQACKDLGLEGNDAKYITAGDAVAKWTEKFAAEKAPEAAEEAWRKTALNGSKGELFSVAWAIGDGEVHSLERTVYMDENGEFSHLSPEADLLCNFNRTLAASTVGRPPFFVGHYVAGFDLKFLFQRMVINNIQPLFPLPFNGRHGSDFYCTKQGFDGFKGSISQDNLCSALNIPGKPDDIDGSKVWDFVKAGNGERVAEYNRDDVLKNREIYKRLNFITSLNALKKSA